MRTRGVTPLWTGGVRPALITQLEKACGVVIRYVLYFDDDPSTAIAAIADPGPALPMGRGAGSLEHRVVFTTAHTVIQRHAGSVSTQNAIDTCPEGGHPPCTHGGYSPS
jgi:hypothetical protein